MNFAEKKKAYQQLQDAKHLDADRELLKQRAHQSPALNTGIVDKQKAQREILWALLDVASIADIKANRAKAATEETVEKTGEGDGTVKTEIVANTEKENVLVETSEKKEPVLQNIKNKVVGFLKDKPVGEKKNRKNG